MALYRPCCLLEKQCFNQTLVSPLKIKRWDNGIRGFKERVKLRPTHVELPVAAAVDGPLTFRTLLKPFVFTIGFTGTTIVGCTIWQYENFRAKVVARKQGWLPRWLPKERKTPQWRQDVNDLWNRLSPGQKFFAPVLFANTLVFLAWKVPTWNGFMIKWFASNPAARVICWPMFLSTFSHHGFLHLAANMFVLHSFCHNCVRTKGREEAAALYLSAGVISSFTSYVYKVIAKKPGLSLGASGAIMAMLGYFCTEHPDAKLSVLFLPMFTFSAGSAIKVMLAVDTAGCLLGWKFFDHAAHLGGAIIGILWANYGSDYVWDKRQFIFRQWHEIRGPV